MNEHTAKKIIIQLTTLLEELKEIDDEQTRIGISLLELRHKIESAIENHSDDVREICHCTLTDVLGIYNEYSDKTEKVFKDIEHLCQVLLTNPEVVIYSTDIAEIGDMNTAQEIFDKLNTILYDISHRRMESLNMRKWIVEMQLTKAMILAW